MHNKLKKIIVIATLANFFVMNLVYLGLTGTGITVIQLQFAFTPERAQQILNLWGASGQELFCNTLYLDYIFPILYGSLLVNATLGIKKKKLLAFAILAPIADIIENSIHYAIIRHSLSIETILWSSVAASIKWLCILVVLASLLQTKINQRTKTKN